MILPNKYVSLAESYIGLSALIIDCIGTDSLEYPVIWEKFIKKYSPLLDNRMPSVDKFMLTLVLMFACGIINYNNGKIYSENIRIKNN